MLFQMARYEIYGGYTGLRFFTKPIRTDHERTVHQSYSTAAVVMT